ncbi:hypothetical protein HY993_04895 [Candidatus Micrarchaeota archaeon]|nr:hypothetical protein [Candidatus Micrarchaeota archaeon]
MKKGFVGPIGDDIPSIFPIVVGVVLFISTIGFVNSQFDARNAQLGLKKAGLGISYAVLRSGYLSDAEFESQCESNYRTAADRLARKYWVNLKKFCYYADPTQDPFSAITTLDSNAARLKPENDVDKTGPKPCFSKAIQGDYEPGAKSLKASARPASYDLMQFPVAVQCNKDATVKGPGMLYVVVWK